MDIAVAPVSSTPPESSDAAVPEPPRPPGQLALGILAVIAVVAALYLARAFFVPLLIGILASYALRPFVDGLAGWRIPRALGAAVVLCALVAGASWAVVAMGDDAASMIEKLPEAARKVRQHVGASAEGGPSALQKIQEAATEIEGAAADATGPKGTGKPLKRANAAIREIEPNTWLRNFMLAQSALLFNVVAQAPIVLLLAYFLLASGDHFRRKLVQWVGPTLTQKKDAVRMLEEIDSQVQRYLAVTVSTNLVVALATWLAFEAMGVEQAGVWGVAAGIAHFVPYLGPLVIAAASGVAGFMQFGTTLGAVAVGGASLVVASVAGMLLATWLQSRFARVNAAVLFIALLFFGWLWGIWGLLLGAPLVAIAKVVCDRVDSLKRAGDLLGH
jgi:predicted PurR-regulated permease PerM